jgi:hypothetical protein
MHYFWGGSGFSGLLPRSPRISPFSPIFVSGISVQSSTLSYLDYKFHAHQLGQAWPLYLRGYLQRSTPGTPPMKKRRVRTVGKIPRSAGPVISARGKRLDAMEHSHAITVQRKRSAVHMTRDMAGGGLRLHRLQLLSVDKTDQAVIFRAGPLSGNKEPLLLTKFRLPRSITEPSLKLKSRVNILTLHRG